MDLSALGAPSAAAPALSARFSAGGALGRTFQLAGRCAVAFGLVSLAFCAPAILLDAAITAADAPGLERASSLLWNLAACAAGGALTVGTLGALDGGRPRASRLLGDGLQSAFRVFGASALSGLLILLGVVALVIPGLFAIAGLYLAPTAAAAEPGRPVRASLSRSWTLTRGHRWGVLALSFVLFLFPVAAIAVQATAAVLAAELGGPVRHAVTAAGGCLTALALGFQSVGAAVAYRSLRDEKDGVPAPTLGAVFE